MRFRAGCFRPFWDAPISQLSDRVVPATRLFGPLAEKTRQAIMCAETDADMTSHAESLLFSGLPDRDPVAEQAGHVVALIMSDSVLQRVDQLSVASGLVGAQPAAAVRRLRGRKPQMGDALGPAAQGGRANSRMPLTEL